MSKISFNLEDAGSIEYQQKNDDIQARKRASREAFLNSPAGANTKVKNEIRHVLTAINRKFVQDRFNAEQALLVNQLGILYNILQSLSSK